MGVSPVQQPPTPTNPLAQFYTAAAQQTPAPADPYGAAVQTAEQRYPWLSHMGVPLRLTSGTGPYMSESYDPKADENPYPGNFTVQLRSPRLTQHPEQWPAALGREGMDYMARHDPVFQSHAKQFRELMTPEQLDRAKTRYDKEQKTGEKRSFEDFLKGAELQEYIGGYVFDMPGWKNAGYTLKQKQLLDNLKDYMWRGQQPTPVDIP